MEKRGLLLILLVLLMPVGFAAEIPVIGVDGGEQTQQQEGITYYAVLNGKVVASVGESVDYYHSDRLGSNIRTSDDGVESESLTLPFGRELSNPDHRFTFTGKELDGDSGLYYFGARYYDYDTGRFTSTDPITDNHAYVYTMNNPLRFVDPTGMRARLGESYDEANLIYGDIMEAFPNERPYEISEQDGQYFLEIVDPDFKSCAPFSQEILNDIITHPEIVFIRRLDSPMISFNTIEARIVFSGNMLPSLFIREMVEEGASIGVFVEKEVVTNVLKLGQEGVRVTRTASGAYEVHYLPTDAPGFFEYIIGARELDYVSYLTLFHELGHAHESFFGDPQPFDEAYAMNVEKSVGAEHERPFREHYYDIYFDLLVYHIFIGNVPDLGR